MKTGYSNLFTMDLGIVTQNDEGKIVAIRIEYITEDDEEEE